MSTTALAPTSPLKGRIEAAIARRLLHLPPPFIAWLLGKRRRVINGIALDPNVQLSLDLFKLTGRPTLDKLSPDVARVEFAKLVPIAETLTPIERIIKIGTAMLEADEDAEFERHRRHRA